MAGLAARMREAVMSAPMRIGRRLKQNFYLYLAVAFTVFVVADAVVLKATANMRQTAFDAMVRYRLIVPRPDDAIVIADIDEKSLAAMAKEYGRWPWPRQVLGEFLENLERQQPKAVVFDILFSDPDVYNTDSDAYFDAAIASTSNTFFPMLRLAESSDSLSQVEPAMIPGVTPMADADPEAHIAVVLPHLPAILKGGRLGLHNVYPDRDGIVRDYLVYREDYGWRIPSLPARVARELGYREAVASRVLLNWRGKPFTYRTVSFSDVFEDMGRKEPKRPGDEFTGKIVIIGSTASSLFDVKPTPMSRLHPGVEILATAIDNLKHGDYLRYPAGRALYPLLTLAIIWAVAWAFYRDAGRDRIDQLFGASQVILIAISYASINFTSTYIDLTGPVTVGLGYFTAARIYAVATHRALERSVLRSSVEQKAELIGSVLVIEVKGSAIEPSESGLKKLARELERIGTEGKSVEILKGRQAGIWALFENLVVVSWVTPIGDDAARARVAKDVTTMTGALQTTVARTVGVGYEAASLVHEGPISGGAAARAGWRALFAEAQLRAAAIEAKAGGSS